MSSSPLSIARYMKNTGHKVDLCIISAYQLLTYGYMIEDFTLFEKIKRIIPGEYIIWQENKLERHAFYKIRNGKIEISESEAIEHIDTLFLKAVERQARKNEEYGYDNYAALSAGLDSRIVCFTLKRLGITNVTAFTYSQSGEFDDILPKKMAADLGYIWIFKNLDNGLDMIEIDQAIKIGEGIQYYLWPAQLNGFLSLIDRNKLGVVHTGVIGDVVVGSFYRQLTPRNYQIGDGAYSRTLLDKLKQIYEPKIQDYEIGMLYNRGINGASTGYSTSFLRCCEPFSPFMDVDFFDFCLSLPTELRIGHKLYYKWVLKKYPEVAKYPHNGLKIRPSKHFVIYHDRPIPINGILDRAISHLKSKTGIIKGMNPVNYWYNNNSVLKNRMDSYFDNNKFLIKDNDLISDVEKLYKNGNVLEKAMCISLVGSLRAFECGT